MARNNESLTRVEYWSSYRQTVKDEFLKANEKPVSPKKKKKKTVRAVPVEKKKAITRAEALLNEYEKKKGSVEKPKANPFLTFLLVVFMLLIAAAIAFLVWRYL